MTAFRPSAEQEIIFDWALSRTPPKPNGLAKAKPGSGKTKTQLETMRLLLAEQPHLKILYAAFNKAIQMETQGKLKDPEEGVIDATASTMHSLGMGMVRDWYQRGRPGRGLTLDTKGKKYRELSRDCLKGSWGLDSGSLTSAVNTLVKFCRQTLTEPTEANIVSLLAQYPSIDVDPTDLDEFWEPVWKSVEPVIKAGITVFQREGVLDYTDQIFLPTALPDVTFPHYDWVFGDEAQDFNRAQQAILLRLWKTGQGARFFGCGDPEQAINGFTGADTESIPRLIEVMDCAVFYLTTCYRCPTNVCDVVRQVYPGIVAAPSAPKGVVAVIDEDSYFEKAGPDDLILARINRILFEDCLHFLRMEKKAIVRGKDVGSSFKSVLYDLKKRRGFTMDNALDLVEIYRKEQLTVLNKDPEENAMAIDALNDKVDTFKVLFQAYLLKCIQGHALASVDGFCTYVDSFFLSDEEGGSTKGLIVLSTVHKAKGLEANVIWIRGGKLFPHPKAKKPWELEQERNLLNVAVSRAKYDKEHPGTLNFVDEVPDRLDLTGEGAPAAPMQVTVTELPPEEGAGAITLADLMGLVNLDLVAGVTCPDCGAPMEEGATVCRSCGVVLAPTFLAPFTALESPEPLALPTPEPAPEEVTVPKLLKRIEELEQENADLRRRLHHQIPEGSENGGDGKRLPNHLAPKVGRTEPETKKAQGAPLKGTGRRQPLQLSLDPEMVFTVKEWGIDASNFFEGHMKADPEYQERLTVRRARLAEKTEATV